jgi:hypothetical protein
MVRRRGPSDRPLSLFVASQSLTIRLSVHPSIRPMFKKNLIRVITIQVVALTLLWLLQSRYHHPG